MSEAMDNLKLATLSNAAQRGDSEEDLKHLLALLDGAKMIGVYEMRGGVVQVKVDRVHSISPHYEGGVLMTFNGVPPDHPKARLIVDEDQRKLARRLREAGWPY